MKYYKAVFHNDATGESNVVLCKKCTTLYKRLHKLTHIKKVSQNKKCYLCPN